MKDMKFKNWKEIVLKENSKSLNLQNNTTAATNTKTKEIPANLLGAPKDCILCQKGISSKKMPVLIHGALYRKYSGDLDSFYSRDIKNILKQRKSRSFIWFVESCIYDDCDEYLTSSYKKQKSLQALHTMGLKFSNKILQPKICIEKYERIHCYNYHKKILLNYKEMDMMQNRDYKKGNKNKNKGKSYSEILMQLTFFKQNNVYNNFCDNGVGSFLFDSKKES